MDWPGQVFLDTDEKESLILAKRIPEPIHKRVLQRPDAFRAFANCDDKTLDKLMGVLGTPNFKRATRNGVAVAVEQN